MATAARARVGLVALGLAGGFDRFLALVPCFFESHAGSFESFLDLGQRRQVRQLVLDLLLLRGDLVAAHGQAAQAILQLGRVRG